MEYESLVYLLGVWKDRLGLSNWRIILTLGGCEDELSYMEIETSTEYERAIIHVNPWLVGHGDIPEDALMREALTPDFIEASLVHELLHLHTRNLRVIIRDDLFSIVQRDVHEQIKNNMFRVEEQMVDRLAESLVKAFNGTETASADSP